MLLHASERFLHARVGMGQSGHLTEEIKQALRELAGARDEARLRAHLLGMDARRRLADIEQEIEGFERKLSARGDWLAEHVVATARGLAHAMGELASRQELEPTRARDLMTRNVVTCKRFERLSDAAQRMWEHDLGALPVVDDDDKPVGMLTDRDVCMAAYTRGVAIDQLLVEGTMSRTICTRKTTDTLRALMDGMATHQVRRMPIVSEEGKLVGIVTLADIARLAQASSPLSHEARAWVPGVLAGISEPTPARANTH